MSSVVATRDLLAVPYVTKVVQTIAAPQVFLTNFLGLQPGSSSLEPVPGRTAGWDIFETTRIPSNFRAPASGPSTVKPQVVGHVNATLARMSEKIPMLDENIFRIRQLGGNYQQVDQAGQQYVTRQKTLLSQRLFNAREFMARSVLKGGFDLLQSGDDWIPVATGSGTVSVDFQVPAGNKSKLDMLGAGDILAASWATAGTDIPAHIQAINEAMVRLHGRPLRHIIMRSANFFSAVLKNTAVLALAGSVNQPYTVISSAFQNNPRFGSQYVGQTVTIPAAPTVLFHLYDGVLDINGTTTPLIENNHAHFLPDPDPSWIGGYEGSEMVRESKVSDPVEKSGMYAYTEPMTQPSGFELIGGDNFIPAPFVPKCITDGLIIY